MFSVSPFSFWVFRELESVLALLRLSVSTTFHTVLEITGYEPDLVSTMTFSPPSFKKYLSDHA